MLVDLDVIVETGTAGLPLGEDVGLARQGCEGGRVEIAEQLAPAGAEVAGLAVVETVEQLADGFIGLGEGEEPAVPEPGEDPALHDLDGDFDLGLVARFILNLAHFSI